MKLRLKLIMAAVMATGMVGSVFAATIADSPAVGDVSPITNHVSQIRVKQDAVISKSSQKVGTQTRVVKHKKVVKQTDQTVSAHDINTVTADEQSVGNNHLTGKQIVKLISEEKEYLPFDLDVPGQAFVSTGPYVGVPIQFAGMNLVVNSPSVNNDLQLLNIRKNIATQLHAMGGEISKEPYHSHLLFSGQVQASAGYLDIGGQASRTGFDLSTVALDAFFIGPSDWTLGFVEFAYDDNSPINTPYGSQYNSRYTVSNSRVYVNKGFITIGNLSESPFYGTLGQYYVPFGVYSSVMVSDPLTKLLTRTKARAALLGFEAHGDNALYGESYIFSGDSHAASVDKVNNGGVSLGYKFAENVFHGKAGVGVIGNIADSAGLQEGNNFQAFEQINHRVPGYNAHANIGIGDHVDLIGEYVGASTSFNQNDMSFNNHGAKPSAVDLEAAYSFAILGDRPSAFGIGYSKSNQALSLGIPLKRYYAVMTTSIWRNTLQAIELRHDQNYASSNVGNGPTGAALVPGACTSAFCAQSGKGDNAITAAFDYYF